MRHTGLARDPNLVEANGVFGRRGAAFSGEKKWGACAVEIIFTGEVGEGVFSLESTGFIEGLIGFL